MSHKGHGVLLSLAKQLFALCFVSVFLLVSSCGTEATSVTVSEASSESLNISNSSSQPNTETSVGSEASTSEEPASLIDYDSLSFSEECIALEEKENYYLKYCMKRNMGVYSVGSRKYGFELEIPESERIEKIRFTEEMLSKVKADPELNIYTYSDLEYPLVEDDCIYIGMSAGDNADYLSHILLGVYGAYCNYGMVYGYSEYLLGVNRGVNNVVPVEWPFYDLNYLCFLPSFASEEDINTAQVLSCSFTGDYIKKNGEGALKNLLEQSGKIEEAELARKELASFYKERGIEADLTDYIFAPGGPNYDYAARCKYATFHPERQYVEGLESEGFMPEGALHKDYSNVIDIMETLSAIMGDYQVFFDLYPYNDELDVFFINQDDQFTMGGLYYPNKHQIYVMSLTNFSHEYIHSLTHLRLKDPVSAWQTEGLASYFSSKHMEFETEYLEYIYSRPKFRNSKYWKYILMYLEGREFDIQSDQLLLDEMETYLDGRYAINGAAASRAYGSLGDYYPPYASFMGYLLDEYGQDKVFDYLFYSHKLSSLGDKYLYQLIDDWKEKLETKFAWIPKES